MHVSIRDNFECVICLIRSACVLPMRLLNFFMLRCESYLMATYIETIQKRHLKLVEQLMHNFMVKRKADKVPICCITTSTSAQRQNHTTLHHHTHASLNFTISHLSYTTMPSPPFYLTHVLCVSPSRVFFLAAIHNWRGTINDERQ